MAFSTGKAGYFAIDDVAGSPYDISAFVTSTSGDRTADEHDTTTYGATHMARILGLKDGKFSVNVNFDATADRKLALIPGRIGTFSFGPLGNGSGNPRLTGEVLCTNYSTDDPVDGLITGSLEFSTTGAVTDDTF